MELRSPGRPRGLWRPPRPKTPGGRHGSVGGRHSTMGERHGSAEPRRDARSLGMLRGSGGQATKASKDSHASAGGSRGLQGDRHETVNPKLFRRFGQKKWFSKVTFWFGVRENAAKSPEIASKVRTPDHFFSKFDAEKKSRGADTELRSPSIVRLNAPQPEPRFCLRKKFQMASPYI